MLDRIFSVFLNKEKKEIDHVKGEMLDESLPSKGRFIAFTQDPVWKYLSDSIAFRIKCSRNDLEDQRLDIDTIRIYQGRIEELRFIESFPQLIIDQYDEMMSEVDAKREANKKDIKENSHA